jgi:hypothetical protein
MGKVPINYYYIIFLKNALHLEMGSLKSVRESINQSINQTNKQTI